MPAFLAAAGQIDYRLAITTDNDLPADPTAELGRLLPCSQIRNLDQVDARQVDRPSHRPEFVDAIDLGDRCFGIAPRDTLAPAVEHDL